MQIYSNDFLPDNQLSGIEIGFDAARFELEIRIGDSNWSFNGVSTDNWSFNSRFDLELSLVHVGAFTLRLFSARLSLKSLNVNSRAVVRCIIRPKSPLHSVILTHVLYTI